MAALSRSVVERANTIEENRKILRQLLRKNEFVEPSHKELNKLFTKLNADNARELVKDMKCYEPDWHGKKVTDRLYGPVPGIPCGSWWGIRMDCSRDRMHDPFSASVQCGPVGAISICTSHSNEDIDLGDILTFTGHSYTDKDKYLGRRIIENKELDQESKSLILNFKNRVPIRIIRSYNLSNEYSPKTGYRYDGLYMVIDYWIGITPQNGNKCYKFALKRLFHQEPPPWKLNTPKDCTESIRISNRYLKNRGLLNQGTSRTVSSNDTMISRSASAKRFQTRNRNMLGIVKSTRRRRIIKPNETNVELEAIQSSSTSLSRKIVSTDHRNVHVSAIVTRRVSKKLSNTCIDNKLINDSKSRNLVKGNESKQLGSEGEEEGIKSQNTRLQNTNISIRTDLYESSHNLKQNLKKCGSNVIHVPGIFKPRPLGVPRRELNFAGVDSSPGSSRIVSSVKMERVKLNDTQINKRNLSLEKDKSANITSDVLSKSSQSLIENSNFSAQENQTVRDSEIITSLPFTEAISSSVNEKRINENDQASGNLESLQTRCLHRLEHSYASELPGLLTVIEETRILDSGGSEDKEKTESCVSEVAGSSAILVQDLISKRTEEKSLSLVSSASQSPPFKGFASLERPASRAENLCPEPSIVMNTLTFEKILNIITADKSSPMAKMLINNVIGFSNSESTPVIYEERGADKQSQSLECKINRDKEERSVGTTKNSQNPEVSSIQVNHESVAKSNKSRHLRPFENSKQQKIIEIVYAGDEEDVIQGSINASCNPLTSENESTVGARKSKEDEKDIFLRLHDNRESERDVLPQDTVDFCNNKPLESVLEHCDIDKSSTQTRKRLTVTREEKDASSWKRNDPIPKREELPKPDAQGFAKPLAGQTSNEIPEAQPRGLKRSRVRIKGTKLEIANLSIDMNMNPRSQISKSRRTLRRANHSCRRSCRAVAERGIKRRNDEPVKHPTNPLKRLKKSIKIQSSSVQRSSAVITKKGLSLRNKTRNCASPSNNNINNNNNNINKDKNNSVKRIGTTDKVMNKITKSINTNIRNIVAKKSAVKGLKSATEIPKRHDVMARTRSGINSRSLTVGRLALRRALLTGTETYAIKKKKKKEKQKQIAEDIQKQKSITAADKQSKPKNDIIEFALKKAKLDYNVYKENKDAEKPKMASVMTQCSLIPVSLRCSACGNAGILQGSDNASEYVCSSNDSGMDQIKNEIELIEIKSEMIDDDVGNFDEEDDETEEIRVQTSNTNSASIGTKDHQIRRIFNKSNAEESAERKKIYTSSSQRFSRSLRVFHQPEIGDTVPRKGFLPYVGRRKSSVVVPVRSVVGDFFRMAHLKSIGFRPIKPGLFPTANFEESSEYGRRSTSDTPRISYSSAVIKRGVHEEYEKYTSEENNVVQYMDSKLCYEDIENEDIISGGRYNNELNFMNNLLTAQKIEFAKSGTQVEEEYSDNSLHRERDLEDEEEEDEEEEEEHQLEEEEEDEVYEYEAEKVENEEIEDWQSQLDENSSNSEGTEQAVVVDSDGDVPWHGWKKITSNKKTYFVGW